MITPTFAEWQQRRGITPWCVVHGQSWLAFHVDVMALTIRRWAESLFAALVVAVRQASHAFLHLGEALAS